MAKMGTLDWIAMILVIIGAVNWGLFGIGGWDLVNMILGSIPILAKIVYILVGLSGLYLIYYITKK
ncbi:DUF378 domain-containing protein [Candidatus Woesearchaeota archaeon]|nr:DUF378 domain-containing protein [Candidatus Woesearchaeota archaeon]MBW3005455.1 DUF378 domain-containing protein [Candidatus Woesearchaeota archaeon]